MKTLQTISILVGVTIIMVGISLIKNQNKFGSAPTGLQASVATSTLAYPVGTSQAILFATSTCSSRVVSTRAEAVMLSFNESTGQVPTATTGHLQLGSTTVVYDSGQFGCGTVRAISATGGATSVGVTESR